ncbi:hydroxycinnamoyltransferase [Andrographis paniculata]|uniref:hydroxycinnamoyltransferase n=1 Tax=Andrographis paniculata TaxID=175694 RepID=UPI0021E8AF9C|nr:hydroxycinnamoyltransferase [Andrographis paniculata]
MAFSGEVLASKLHVEALQSVVPKTPTDPRISSIRRNAAAILHRRFHALLLYHNNNADHTSGSHVAAGIKASLQMALQDHPLLAGRLRPAPDGGQNLEIVSNDSGARIVEARADFNLHEFLDFNNNGGAADHHLVFWEDVDHDNPQFCPLFYVQVTKFGCGGYSIGISCSLLVMDPFVLTAFIKKWADIHNRMLQEDAQTPMLFYLPSMAKPLSYQPLQTGSNATKNSPAASVIFKTPTKAAKDSESLALMCIERAESEIGAKMPSEVCLFAAQGDPAEVEVISQSQGVLESLPSDNIGGSKCVRTWWDEEFGLGGVCFVGKNKPAYASSWMNSIVEQGCVMIVGASDHETKVVVTFT